MALASTSSAASKMAATTSRAYAVWSSASGKTVRTAAYDAAASSSDCSTGVLSGTPSPFSTTWSAVRIVGFERPHRRQRVVLVRDREEDVSE
jgi:hypothetical protein